MGEISFQEEETVIDKSLDEWNHKDFLKYWDTQYKKYVHPCAPRRSPKEAMKLKAAISSSIDRYGTKILRDMVDYAFNHYKDFPTWKMESPMIVFAAHGWSAMMYTRVQNNGKVIQSDDLDRMLS
jgi:hypothetical protein